MVDVCRYVVILAGGSGERLWPLSTPERPKQFVKIFGGKSLIRQALERVLPLVPAENVLAVTAKSLGRATREELPELPRENLLLEPCRKNTGPAVATALGEIRRRRGTRSWDPSGSWIAGIARLSPRASGFRPLALTTSSWRRVGTRCWSCRPRAAPNKRSLFPSDLRCDADLSVHVQLKMRRYT